MRPLYQMQYHLFSGALAPNLAIEINSIRMNSYSSNVRVLQKIKRIRLVDVAIVAASVLAAAGFWTRNILLIALIIPAVVILVTHRATTREERERRETLSLYSLAISLFIPIIIIFALIIYAILKIIPLIIDNWQG
ncbi:MAG: hypothetical protein JRH12_18240 [Deltaproteobacteria bacterium]|jgi:uncharacterized membrane protein YphA (DoxX/SURF4 family)|nr:hypothetical protein [Deltaproteobacteria bacterium]